MSTRTSGLVFFRFFPAVNMAIQKQIVPFCHLHAAVFHIAIRRWLAVYAF